jgi:hypothetical protein
MATAEERRAALEEFVAARMAEGWRVESRSEFSVTMVRGKRINHILHLLLTIITAGLWVIVWILLALGGGEKHGIVTVDEDGVVTSRLI